MKQALRNGTNRLKPFQESAKSGNGTNRLSRTDRYFIIFGKAAGIVEPCQRTFNDPLLGRDLPFRFDAYRNIHAKSQYIGNILFKGLAVSRISTKSHYLQRSYDQMADTFGLSKKQATEAVKALEKMGIIKRIFKTIQVRGQILNNVLFIELIPQRLYEVTFPEEIEENTLLPTKGDPSIRRRREG